MTTLTENNIFDFLRKSKIKTYNILNYYFSGFCTIKKHTRYWTSLFAKTGSKTDRGQSI